MNSVLAVVLLALAPVLGAGAEGCEQRVARYLELLAAYRAGDDLLASDLSAAARELCSECERCDAEDVATFYMSLAPEGRAAGLVADAEFLELYGAVLSAGSEGLAGEDWARERERLLAELHALAARARVAADFVPAARALSLAARLEVERLELDPELSPREQDAAAERASQAAREADSLFELAGQLTPRLEPLWVDARIELARAHLGAAHAGFARVLEISTRVANDEYREHALRGQLALARSVGDALREERLLARLATFRDPRSSWPLARDWSARLLSLDHAEEALEFLELTRPPPGAHELDRLEWDLSVGACLLRMGEAVEARAHLERAAAGVPSEAALLALGQLALEEGRGFELRDLLDDPERLEGFSPRGRAEALRILGEERLSSGDAAGAVGELEASLELARNWRAGVVERTAGDGLGPGVIESVFGEWAGLHTLALLAEAHVLEGHPLEALRRIAGDHANSLREARRASLRPGDGGTYVSAELHERDLAAWIDRAELGLVGWVLGADFGVVVHAWREDGELHALAARVPHGRAAIADATRRLREATISTDPGWIQLEARALRRALFPGAVVASLVRRARARGPDARLFALVHGPLERLPLELLPIDDGGRALDELLTICLLPGLPDATPPEPVTARELSSWNLLGAPPAAGELAELPGARLELRAIAALHAESRVHSGSSFRLVELERAIGEPRALHVATHLVRGDGGAGDLALVAAGGERLEATRIRALASALPLVVLPACETGGGAFVDGQGLHGVARAFLAAGARGLVVTGWPVEDMPARRFGVAFHQALVAGLRPSAAVRTGRQALRDAGAGPADWAAFHFIGAD